MIVMKFGGTSVESQHAIARVAGIVRKYQDRHPVVVVTATAPVASSQARRITKSRSSLKTNGTPTAW